MHFPVDVFVPPLFGGTIFVRSSKSGHCRMHRLRLSSEGPEVVPRIPDKFFVPYLNRSPRSAIYQKQFEANGRIPLYPIPSTREGSSRFDDDETNRTLAGGSCGLITILLVIGAFLLGSGIGGGIGGIFISKDQAKITRWVLRIPNISK